MLLTSPIVWKNVDYLECSRYVALNWSNEKRRRSSLRRILPWRRKTQGTRPGIKGSGPRGRWRGDTEQWVFPRVVLTELEKKELVATVVEILVDAMFTKHYYTFGNKVYHQRKGGPIGLRGTCAVARVTMQLFDIMWRERLDGAKITTWLLARYMDDARAFMPAFKHGLRWVNNKLQFCQQWVVEDGHLTPTELTKQILAGTMQGIEAFLEFTFETCEQFNGWLPTLDTCVRVNEKNVVEYNYYEKETCSSMTVQSKSAMNENIKIQIVSQDMVRRLMNTKEELGAVNRGGVVDRYARKLLLSGYSKEQTRRILKNGIKGFESKRRSRLARGLPLRSTASGSSKSRYMKKLLGKTTWYKSRRNHSTGENNSTSGKGAKNRKHEEQDVEPQTVLFVEYSKNGELANKMKELTRRLAQTVGFHVKVVERAGTSLRNQFPTTTLWDGSHCGRKDCVTCSQGAEKLPNCKKASIVYENVCLQCNPGADAKGELREVKDDTPTLYVGESSRTIFERSKEHWEAWRSRKEDSHILKHQMADHGGSNSPKFTMRVVRSYRSALSRQVGEAVRIRRRGGEGSILNSKSEFNRCRIPRLVLEEIDEEQADAQEDRELREALELLEQCERAWEDQKTKDRGEELREARNKVTKIKERVTSRKREQEQPQDGTNKRRRKKLKHSIEAEGWGQEHTGSNQIGSSAYDAGSSQDTESYPGSWIPEATGSSYGCPRELRQTSIMRYAEQLPPKPAGKETANTGLGYSEPLLPEPAGNDYGGTLEPDSGEGRDSFATTLKRKEEMNRPLRNQEELSEKPPDTVGNLKDGCYGVNMEEEEQSAAPSSTEPSCNINRKGFCSTHQVQTLKTSVTSKKWGDRGGGRGYGYITRKTSKYICKPSLRDQRDREKYSKSRNLNQLQITGCEDRSIWDYGSVAPGGLSDNEGLVGLKAKVTGTK